MLSKRKARRKQANEQQLFARARVFYDMANSHYYSISKEELENDDVLLSIAYVYFQSIELCLKGLMQRFDAGNIASHSIRNLVYAIEDSLGSVNEEALPITKRGLLKSILDDLIVNSGSYSQIAVGARYEDMTVCKKSVDEMISSAERLLMLCQSLKEVD